VGAVVSQPTYSPIHPAIRQRIRAFLWDIHRGYGTRLAREGVDQETAVAEATENTLGWKRLLSDGETFPDGPEQTVVTRRMTELGCSYEEAIRSLEEE
jgi:hypothetical protein